MKLVEIYRIARMGQNFDDYPGFQQIPGMPILFQESVCSFSVFLDFSVKSKSMPDFSVTQSYIQFFLLKSRISMIYS